MKVYYKINQGEVFNMMGGHGFGMMGMMGIGWIINLLLIGVVVYFAVKLALRDNNKN